MPTTRKADGTLILPLGPHRVSRISFDGFRLGLSFLDGPGESAFELWIESAFTYHPMANSALDLDPTEANPQKPLEALVGELCTRTEVREGTLRCAFQDGTFLEVPSHPNYEAWEVVEMLGGPERCMVVAMPGGGEPAIWGSITDQMSE